MILWPNVGLMLVHRLRHLPDISTTSGQHLVFAGYCLPSKHERLAQRWFTVGSPAQRERWFNMFTVGPPSMTLAQQ